MEPLKKIEVNFTPGTIEFPSADRLKLYVNEMLEKTKGLVATDDSIKATKASRTEVNKLESGTKDQLDNLARYCVQAGINVIKASDRETIIE